MRPTAPCGAPVGREMLVNTCAGGVRRDGHVQVRLLGPVDVVVAGEARPVRGLRRKAVLAVLALNPGEIVSTDRLMDVVWSDTTPARLNTVQSHVSYLRRVLGGRSAIRAHPPGYVLDLGDDATDVQTAGRMIERARVHDDPADSASVLAAALQLWRGRPLADVCGLAWLDEQAERLDGVRRRAEQALIEARMALGEHARLVPELERLARERPFDERVHELLMLALYRAGRQADALGAFRTLRSALGANLGIDPSPVVRDLEVSILRQEPALAAPRAPLPVTAPAGDDLLALWGSCPDRRRRPAGGPAVLRGCPPEGGDHRRRCGDGAGRAGPGWAVGARAPHQRGRGCGGVAAAARTHRCRPGVDAVDAAAHPVGGRGRLPGRGARVRAGAARRSEAG